MGKEGMWHLILTEAKCDGGSNTRRYSAGSDAIEQRSALSVKMMR